MMVCRHEIAFAVTPSFSQLAICARFSQRSLVAMLSLVAAIFLRIWQTHPSLFAIASGGRACWHHPRHRGK